MSQPNGAAEVHVHVRRLVIDRDAMRGTTQEVLRGDVSAAIAQQLSQSSGGLQTGVTAQIANAVAPAVKAQLSAIAPAHGGRHG